MDIRLYVFNRARILNINDQGRGTRGGLGGGGGTPPEMGVLKEKNIFKKISYLFGPPWKKFVPSPLLMMMVRNMYLSSRELKKKCM